MAEKKPVLIVDMQSRRQFNGRASVLTLTNTTNHQLRFKVITTTPKICFVDQSDGLLEAKGVVAVTVFSTQLPSTVELLVKVTKNNANTSDGLDKDLWKDAAKVKWDCAPTPITGDLEIVTKPKDEKERILLEAIQKANSLEVEGNNLKEKNLQFQPTDKNKEKLVKAIQEIDSLKAKESKLVQENLKIKAELLEYKNVFEKFKELAESLPCDLNIIGNNEPKLRIQTINAPEDDENKVGSYTDTPRKVTVVITEIPTTTTTTTTTTVTTATSQILPIKENVIDKPDNNAATFERIEVKDKKQIRDHKEFMSKKK